MNKNDVPILLIGLGGIGSSIVNETYGKLKKNGDVDFLEALAFDTDQAEMSRLDNIPKDCQVQTSTDKSVKYVLERDKNAGMWFPIHPKILDMQLIKGAGQIRAVSRLALRSAMKEGKLNKIQKIKDKLYRLGTNAPEKGVRIVIVASMMGGTGSGMFLQIPLYLREIMQSQYSADRIEIQGVFILPDVLKGSVNGKEEVNVYANAYAAMKEMNAIILSLTKQGDTVELEYKPDQVVEGADNNGIGVKDWPYDYCFVYDKEDTSGRNIGELADYKHMIADNLYSQVYGPVSDAIHSHFINEIRGIIRKNSKNIFGGIAIGKLIYPYEDILNYITNKAIFDNLEQQLLRIDTSYNNKIEQENKDKLKGNDTEKTILSEYYMNEFETLVKDPKNNYFKNINRQVASIDENGEQNGYLSDDFLDYIDRTCEDQAEDFKNKLELHQPNKQKLENAPEGQVRNLILNQEEEYKEFKKAVDAKMESMGEMRANNDFKLYDEKEKSKLDEYLQHEEKYVNPVGIRYLLYRIQDGLREMKDDYSNRAENLRSDLSNKEVNKVGALFKNKTTLSQALDHALKANKNPADKLMFKSFQKFKDEYQNDAMKHYVALSEYARVKYESGYLKTMFSLISKLIEEYEGMFKKLEEQKKTIEKRVNELENKGNNAELRPNIYVLKKKEYMVKLWDSIPIDERVNNLMSVLPEKMHENLKINCKRKINGQDQNAVAYDTLFNELIVKGCRESIKNNSVIKGTIDMNVIRALAKEYEFAKDLGEISDVKNEEEYVKEKLKDLTKLTKPFAARSDDASDFIVWGINDNLRFASESNEGKTKLEGMIEEATDFSGKKIVADSEYSKYEIEYIHTSFGLMLNDFTKFSDVKGKEGEYYRCYEQVIKDVSNDFSGIGRNVEITPHIDRDWHEILPPIGEERMIEDDFLKAKAFITCLPLEYVIVEKRQITKERVKLEFKRSIGAEVPMSILAHGEKVEGNIARLYEAFQCNPKLRKSIIEAIDKHIAELKDDSSLAEKEESYIDDKFIKRFSDFKIPGYSDIKDVLDLLIILFRETKNLDEKKKIDMFSNLITGLCEIIEDIASAYVENDKEAVAAACKEILEKLIEKSNLAKEVTESSPEYTYTLGIFKRKIKEYEEK